MSSWTLWRVARAVGWIFMLLPFVSAAVVIVALAAPRLTWEGWLVVAAVLLFIGGAVLLCWAEINLEGPYRGRP